jgi:hypothetical protein
MELPKFVSLKETTLRLTKEKTYYRDAGEWGIEFECRDGKIFSVFPEVTNLHNVELKFVTEQEYIEDNGSYSKLQVSPKTVDKYNGLF